jgi:hypothetical protein
MTSNDPIRPRNETDPAAPRADRVGYGHPPQHSRYRPGQSGNPSGRPKGRRSFKKDMAAALDALGRAEGGKTKQQLLAENLVNDALARNPVALKIVAPIVLALDDEEKDREEEVTALQQSLIEEFDHREASTDSTDGGKK